MERTNVLSAETYGLKNMNPTKELRYKDKVKHEGHDLIDRLLRMGVKRAGIYAHLSHKLGWRSQLVHFSAPHTTEELQRMRDALQEFHNHIWSVRRKKKEKKPKPTPKLKSPVVLKAPPPVPVIQKPKVVGLKPKVLDRERMIQAMATLRQKNKIAPKETHLKVLLRFIGVLQ